MNKPMYKVKTIEDNNLISKSTINDRLKPAFLVSFLDPSVSIPFLQMTANIDDETLTKFSSNQKVEPISIEQIIFNAANDICLSIEESVKKDDLSSTTIVDLGKKVIEDKVLSRQIENSEETMSVEDLMSKLYGNNEESKGLGK